MKETRVIMGMPVVVNVVGGDAAIIERVFSYFQQIDERFSTYKSGSEISRINRGEITPENYSNEMREVFSLAEKTKQDTDGYFDIQKPDGNIDPSGLVKGWAIRNAAKLIKSSGYMNFWVEAGGDIQVSGSNDEGASWRVGIRNPFKKDEIIKIVELSNAGIATSGTYIRGEHIYDPHTGNPAPRELASITILADDVYDADRFATAAYAMGKPGISYAASVPGLAVYAVDTDKKAFATENFNAVALASDSL